jgi:protease IV
MKQFLKFMFASCLGVFIAMIALFFFGIASIAGLSGGGGEEGLTKEVKSNSVLEIKLESSIPQLTDNVEKSPFESQKTAGLHDLTLALEHAANDNNIKGVVINTRYVMTGFATLTTLRKAIDNFKQKSGKFVYAYSDFMSQGAYYVSSVADSIMIHPKGGIEFAGLSAEVPFMKDLFTRLDVNWQIYYAGQFKSATEPLRLDKMSDQNRLQTREYINGLNDMMLADISKSRNISVEDLKNIANEYKLRRATDAVTYKMATTEGYYDQFLMMVKKKLDLKEKDKLNSISLNDYASTFDKNKGSGKEKIAIVYAEGNIGYGAQNEEAGTIEGERYAKMIRKLRLDDKVKAIVLRVNSGGGSSFGSDIIWRELDLARKQGKTIISSFGDYAASGGYYIAMASDSIFAEPNTITGSIGVFAMIPGLQKTFKNKMGISFDTVRTGKYSAMSGVNIDFTPEEGRILQESVDTMYEQFLQLVGNNRKMTRDQVHAIAQGRVWLGTKGKEIGLVDRLGSLDDAIKAAATKANLKEYKIVEYPKSKEGIQKFIEGLTGQKPADDMAKAAIKKELGEYSIYFDYLTELKKMQGPQMRMPFVLRFK